MDPPDDMPTEPKQVGGYRILGTIGAGGMGIVYRAEQSNPRRTVAVKVIRGGIPSAGLLRRFRDEAQALGRLHHPGIAQIYEAGATDAEQGGRPFIAMELVEGQPITRYARDRALRTRERLALMAQVCDAVHHAHQKGIIHRDLKPGNILVDGAGQPRIVDFGIARLTDADLQITTLATNVGQLIGTLPYMSPEQIAADPLRLDTRSDVYALGVILYELLAERLPYDLQNKSVPEAARVIGEEDPTPLSTFDRVLRGDVETIVSKALEKDKDRRYGSASELGEDIRRYLRNEPITARPASTLYQLRKFARRHRTLVGATVAVFLVLVAGITGTTIALVRASRAEQVAAQRQQDAERSAAIAAAVNEFLNNDLLSSVSPDQSGRNTTVKEVLDRASASIEDRFQDAPLVEAAIRATLGTTYHKLGQYEDAEPHIRRAVELQEAWRGSSASESLESKIAAAELLIDLGRLEEADRRLNEVRAALGEKERTDHLEDKVQIASGALRIAQGRYDEAEADLSEGTSRLTAKLGPEHRGVLAARMSLAKAKTFRGMYPEAEDLYEEILEVQRRTLGGAHPDAIATTNLLASLYLRREKDEQALQLLEETHRATIDTLGEEHPESISILNNIAAANKMLGNYDVAEPMYLRAIDLCNRHLPPNHAQQITALNNLARLYDAQNEFERAEPVYLDALRRRREALGVDHPDTCGVEENLAGMYRRMDRIEEARQLIEHVLKARLAQLGAEHRETIYSIYQLGSSLLQLGRVDEAEVRFNEALTNARESFEPTSPWLGKYLVAHAEALMRLERYEEAERELQTAHDVLMGSIGPQDALTMRAAQRLAELLEATGRNDEADEWRRRTQGGAEE